MTRCYSIGSLALNATVSPGDPLWTFAWVFDPSDASLPDAAGSHIDILLRLQHCTP